MVCFGILMIEKREILEEEEKWKEKNVTENGK